MLGGNEPGLVDCENKMVHCAQYFATAKLFKVEKNQTKQHNIT